MWIGQETILEADSEADLTLTAWVLRAWGDSPREAVLLAPSEGALNSERVKHRHPSHKE